MGRQRQIEKRQMEPVEGQEGKDGHRRKQRQPVLESDKRKVIMGTIKGEMERGRRGSGGYNVLMEPGEGGGDSIQM